MLGFTMDGKSLAFQSRQIIKEELLSWKRKGYQAPGLAVINVLILKKMLTGFTLLILVV